jgi:hypothetical protein
VLIQATGLALLAAISPTALVVAAAYIGSPNPRTTLLLYLAGAVTVTVVLAVALYLVLKAGHLDLSRRPEPRYNFRLALGVLLLLASAFFAWRARRRGPPRPDKGLVGRLLARPGHRTAFVVGVIVYGPSITLIAAIQVIATARPSTASAVLALTVVVAISLLCVWLPFLLYLLAPGRTTRSLGVFNALLQAHGHLLVVGALGVAGVYLVANGVLGLTGVVG